MNHFRISPIFLMLITVCNQLTAADISTPQQIVQIRSIENNTNNTFAFAVLNPTQLNLTDNPLTNPQSSLTMMQFLTAHQIPHVLLKPKPFQIKFISFYTNMTESHFVRLRGQSILSYKESPNYIILYNVDTENVYKLNLKLRFQPLKPQEKISLLANIFHIATKKIIAANNSGKVAITRTIDGPSARYTVDYTLNDPLENTEIDISSIIDF